METNSLGSTCQIYLVDRIRDSLVHENPDFQVRFAESCSLFVCITAFDTEPITLIEFRQTKKYKYSLRLKTQWYHVQLFDCCISNRNLKGT